MEINSQLPQTSLYNLFNAQKEQNETAQTQTTPTEPIKKISSPIKEDNTPTDSQSKQRETYGLLVLELMSNDEYNAFKRATAGMSEGDKMLAAQSLYSLTNFYNGKYNPELQQNTKISTNPYEKNAQKAFGIQTQNLNSFLERYKNAYQSSNEFDIML
ncbi:hypothetical protein [Helicobacter cappadocius]|uniref:Uncharacterized protein n=1 Tax=Helicobacter cappadocius TaxID=3063998 RepID=A0AA90PKG9_9HELI|nr:MULTISPECIES: hypothetical protein [unclassified Helicobacter]MDO7253221.1 hypothetical protein [Helicobacter sp. faydin-H75]MDP2539145.1 hypothetical protein [Helicobacter sp. faydin-H76]